MRGPKWYYYQCCEMAHVFNDHCHLNGKCILNGAARATKWPQPFNYRYRLYKPLPALTVSSTVQVEGKKSVLVRDSSTAHRRRGTQHTHSRRQSTITWQWMRSCNRPKSTSTPSHMPQHAGIPQVVAVPTSATPRIQTQHVQIATSCHRLLSGRSKHLSLFRLWVRDKLAQLLYSAFLVVTLRCGVLLLIVESEEAFGVSGQRCTQLFIL